MQTTVKLDKNIVLSTKNAYVKQLIYDFKILEVIDVYKTDLIHDNTIFENFQKENWYYFVLSGGTKLFSLSDFNNRLNDLALKFWNKSMSELYSNMDKIKIGKVYIEFGKFLFQHTYYVKKFYYLAHNTVIEVSSNDLLNHIAQNLDNIFINELTYAYRFYKDYVPHNYTQNAYNLKFSESELF